MNIKFKCAQCRVKMLGPEKDVMHAKLLSCATCYAFIDKVAGRAAGTLVQGEVMVSNDGHVVGVAIPGPSR